MPVALVSGGSMESVTRQVISRLSHAQFGHLYALPTSGAEMRAFERGAWRVVYSFPIGDADRRVLFEELAGITGISTVRLGGFVEDRGTQITYAALGIDAPLDIKYAWDPTREKRKAIVARIAPRLPGLSVTIGGSTSIDFTEKGVDKAFGVSRLLEHLGIQASDAVFVGDALDAGGNDAPVKAVGVKIFATRSLAETESIIRGILDAEGFSRANSDI